MVIIFNKELFSVFKMEHRTPGNLRGFVQAKMRNFRTGTMIEHRFSSEDKVERASLDEQEMEYLYDDGEYFYFMNTTTFDLERGFSPMAPAMMITRDIASAMSVTPMIVGNPM